MVTRLIAYEIGHTMGLGHSSDSHSVMYPVLPDAGDTLDGADIQAVGRRHALQIQIAGGAK